MPMPKPHKTEDHDKFIARCMSDDMMMSEFEKMDQRMAVCSSQWRKEHSEGKSADDMEYKTAIAVEFKAEKEGMFVARIATLNVRDLVGDVTLPGAFPEGKALLVSAFGHASSMGDALPVGKAIVHEQGGEVIAEGQFFLGTSAGKDHYDLVKAAGDILEWSYGYRATEWEMGEWEGKEARLLKKVNPFEVSPVLMGAGLNTRTLAVKRAASLAEAAAIDQQARAKLWSEFLRYSRTQTILIGGQ